MTRVWLDDIREEPEGWTRTYTVEETIELLQSGDVSELSLDNDLGENIPGGNQVVKWLEYQDKGQGLDLWPEVIYIHSSNSVERANMERAINASGHYGRKKSGIINGQWSNIDGFMREDDNTFVSSSVAAYRRIRDVYFI